MTRIARAIAALVVIASVAHAERGPSTPPDPLPVERFRLGNGLVVVLAPDASASAVAVHLRWQAGAASEPPDEAGYSRLVEKLLAMGSVHVADPDARIEAVGGWSSTSTTADYLGVTDHVPAHVLELVLWLEAERMAGLAEALTEEKVAAARDAVQAEWRAAYVDEPYAIVEREVERALWIRELEPLGRPVLGDGKAVARADRASVRRAVQHRLVPNLATLVIAGRFELAATKRMVERYFGWMPMRHGVTPFREHGMLYARAVERIVRAPLRQVVVAYQTPPFDLTADVAAYLLANGRDARLQALVARGLATDVRGEVRRGQVGELRIVATPAPGVDPRVLATAIRDEAGRLSERASDDEADAALWRAETDAYLALENLAVRAELFGTYAQQSRHASLLDAWPRGSRPKSGFGIKLELAHMLSPSGAVTVIGSPEAR